MTEPVLVWAVSFVDVRLDEGHVERWLGSGSVRDGVLVPRTELGASGADVADERSLLADLGMALSNVDRGALESALVEIARAARAALAGRDAALSSSGRITRLILGSESFANDHR